MKKFLTISLIALVAIIAIPVPVSAAVCSSVGSTYFGTPQNFSQFVCLFVDLIEITIPIIAGLALLTFFWGLVKFIWNAGDTGSHETGKQLMIWGTVALFVMVSVWALVRMVHGDLFGSTTIGIPRLPFSQ